MKRKLMFFALAAIGLASCNGFKKGDSGMLYKIITDKPGPSIKEGDFVSLNFIIKNDADSVLANSYESGHTQQFVQKIQQKGDVFSGLAFLSEGDSAIIKMDIDSTSKGRPKPPGFKGKYVSYTVKIEKVIAKGNLSEQVFNGRINDFLKGLADVAKKAEPIAINKYIADNKLKVTKTPSGLSYVITKEGTGTIHKITVTNTGKLVAFFVHLRALKNKNEDDILPVIFDDNYLLLAPGESRTINCSYENKDAGSGTPYILTSAWNADIANSITGDGSGFADEMK